MMTAILERLQVLETRVAQSIDALGAQVDRQMASLQADVNRLREDGNSLRADVNSLREDVNSLREDVNKRLDHLASKIQVLNDDTLDVRGSQRQILKRMSEFELKAS